MVETDYYELLQVARTADPATIKAAYRKLAMECHPDRNGGCTDAEAKFKALSEAYDCLKDPQRRAAYDRFGHAAFRQGGMGGNGHAGAQDFGSFADIFDNIFGEFMGGSQPGRSRGNVLRGSDLRYDLEIMLEDAFHGREVELQVDTSAPCEPCEGSGAKSGTQARTCVSCGGRGQVRARQGFFVVEQTCPNCRGVGETIADPCPACRGEGRVEKRKALKVDIPAGVDEGTRIRLAGEGEAGVRGGPSGDLYIFLSIATHAFFQRDGADLHCRVPISMVQAALGGEFEVPTIEGAKTRVKVPEGTQSGRRFRLHGKGMPVLRSRQTGDMYVQVMVETPQKLTKRQRELLNEFEKLSSQETHPESAGFFGKMRELLGGRANSA